MPLIQDYTLVGLPVEIIVERWAGAGEQMLACASARAHRTAVDLIGVDDGDESPSWEIWAGPARERYGARRVLPFLVDAQGSSLALCHMDGDFELTPLASKLSHLKLLGSYKPSAQRGITWPNHTWAEVCARQLLVEFVAELEAPATSP